jgi:hypothetical protein
MVMAATTTAQALSEALWLVLRNFITLFGIVRSEASKQALVEAEGVPKDHVLVADVTLAEAVKDAVQTAIEAGWRRRQWARRTKKQTCCRSPLALRMCGRSTNDVDPITDGTPGTMMWPKSC